MWFFTNYFYSLLFLLLPVGLYGQHAARAQYSDLDLYYALVEAEKRDSTYHKALLRWQNSTASLQEANFVPVMHNRKFAGTFHSALALPEQTPQEVRAKIEAFLSLAALAAKQKEQALEIDVLRRAFMLAFWSEPKDYYKAFTISCMLEEKLPAITESEYPYKRLTYYRLGEAYYLFLDFRKSIELLEQALSPVPLAFDDQTNLNALKIIGICYANIEQMDTSDTYFRTALLSDEMVLNRPFHNAYALSHLACNAMLTQQYDKALTLSAAVWETLKKTGDNGHLAGMCYCRGRSYLKKGDFKQANLWVDSLVYFTAKDDYNKIKRLKQSYALRAEYFTAMGDAYRAQAYNDTLNQIYKTEQTQFTSYYILRASEDYKDSKLKEQGRKLKVSQAQLAFISIFSLVVTLVAAVIIYLYRRNQAAYKALVVRAREWAARDCPPVGVQSVVKVDENKAKEADKPEEESENENQPTAEDRAIMLLVYNEMTTNQTYLNADLTLESLAKTLSVRRGQLSRAINRTTGENFKQYVNSLRIKEAVRIISETPPNELSFEELYECVGFSSRTSFYRAFKQMTGLSPREFLNNG